ncbi:uncharacterized protein LOC133188722 [Saccostrea echinata]|uniref:uncharacterized protein LOC133188722 n=1 Tax=Saccostrea echinata TaxID=191078 RepID=UPI002A7FD97C|nr:uncharacterized protein LOC133188722 [Saccostrea echinata]
MDRNGIGAPNLQEYYDSLIYDKPTDTGTEIAHKMASNLGKMFETLTNQLQNVKRAIEDQYEHFSSSDLEIFPQCCKITGNYNPKFRTKVSESSACISKSTTSDHYPNKDIETVMKKNYERNPNILWQYFGGSDGTFLIYPSHGFSPNCFSYDPRFRPYYVASATNKPKDVVVAVDTSGITTGRSSYESRTLLSVAREAVQYVIDTLNPNDRIGIVAFNEEVIKPTSCHGTHLAKATTTNKEVLKRFTNDWVSSKQSHYDEGIKAAFSYFNIKDISTQGGERESVILFLAAGDNAGDDPVDVIKTENEARNNSVTILTYSFGGGLSDHWKKVLQNMSKQVTNDRSFGPVKEGTYKEVKDDSLLRSDMASYYKDLSSTNLGSNPVFSVPYVDGRSKETGLITSLCLPVETSGSLRGVTCTDILLDELLSDITNFKQGELSYAFMIDGQGRVMVHYLQPTPNAITIDPDPIDIHVLEPSVDAKPMIESMKRGESGNNSFSYFRTISRGILEYEGIEARSVEADYSWTKVPGTNFSLCVVLGKNDQQSQLKPGQQGLSRSGVFYYHRLDLNSQNTQKCREYERYATKEKSMVMLSPHTFEKPYEYLYKTETQAAVVGYSNYLNSIHSQQTENELKLKDNVKSSVQATYKAEEFWRQNQDQSQFVIWRYLGTRDGHVRVYPAVEIRKDYDPFTRPWWRRTVAQKGKYVVITPYVDNWGAGVVVTQCKAIYEGRADGQHSADDIVDVVQCIDYPYPYFSRMFLSNYPECANNEYSCMVIDISGFLVIYPSFSIVVDNPDIELKHLGVKEKKIMDDLLKDKNIERESCLDIENKKQLFSYRVKLSDTADPVNKLSSVGYKIAPVLNSNVYIIIKKEELNSGTCCQNSGISPLEYTCTNSGSDCCLCHKIVPYDTCQEKTTSGEKYHTCSARLPDSNVKVQPELDKIKELDLKPCFDAGCNARDEKNCYQVAGCSWCVQDENGKPFSQSETCCNIIETCPFGKVQNQKKTQCLASQTPDHSAQADDTPIVAGGTGGGVVIIIILAIIIAVVCRKRNKKDDKKATYLTVVTDNPGFSSAEERRSESDTSINYLRGEDESSHQSNQYIGMQSPDDGSCTAHVGDNPKKPNEKSKDIAVWNDFLVIRTRPRKRQSIKRVTPRPTVKPTDAPKTTTSTPDPTTTTATLKPEISGARLAAKTEEYSGMALILYLALVSQFSGIVLSEDINSLTGFKFSEELKVMEVKGICAPSLQNYYDTLLYDESTDTAAIISQKMAENLKDIFKTLTDQLKKLKQVIAQEYDNFAQYDTGDFPQCCKVNGIYNPKFRTEISENNACISKSSSSSHFPSQQIKTIMEENYRQNPNMLWQYFGGSDGTFLIYPSHAESQNCQSYDPRFKQYYVASMTNKPKDVVVAVDVSEFTARLSIYNSKPLFHLAREAVQYVIESLSPNDRIGLVAFSQVGTPISCNGTRLARATKANKVELQNFPFTNTWNKQSNYDEGIQTAFSFFDSTDIEAIGNKRESVILFLAAGNNTGNKDPVDVIKTENEARNNSVIILTYSFGQGLSNHSKDVLRDMSKQVKNDRSYGPIKEGVYHEVYNDSQLRIIMGLYYEKLFFSTNFGDDPVFSLPYVDERSNKTALITSLCLPVDNPRSIVGVTCTDILLDELLSDNTNFKEGELSYAFMIDGQGRVMVHYLQPTPNDPDPIDIYMLEQSPDAKPMIESMKRGESGSATFSYSRTLSRGELEYDGIETRIVEADYSWIKIPGTNFSLCVVLGRNDKQLRLRPGQERLITNGVFYYHKLEMNRQQTQKCRQYNRFATREKSMVMLSPHAFEEPYEYLYRTETQEAVFDYSDYLNSVQSQQADNALKLKAQVKSSIQATYMAEEFWKQNQDQSQFVIWRYLGTRDGHVRVYPAVEIPKNYDPFTRDWWRKTVGQKGKNVVISPYIDKWGGGLVVSQCKAIFEGRCMVIDTSGFLVIYTSFESAEEFTRKHLGEKVSLSDTARPVNKLSTKGYMIAPVLNSNVYIIIKKEEDGSSEKTTCCQNSEKSPLVQTCSSASESHCCLCHTVVPYDTCEDKTTSGDEYNICSVGLPDSNVKVQKESDKTKELELCFDVNCNARNESNCKGVTGCSWCTEDENDKDFLPCCNVFETCPFGKVQPEKQTHCSATLYEKHFSSTDSNEVGTVTGIVIGVIFLIAVLSVIIVIIYRKRRKDKEDPYYLDPTLDPCQYNPAFSTVVDHREDDGSCTSNHYKDIHSAEKENCRAPVRVNSLNNEV